MDVPSKSLSPPEIENPALCGVFYFYRRGREEEPCKPQVCGFDKFVGNKFERACAERSEPEGQGAWMHPVIPTDRYPRFVRDEKPRAARRAAGFNTKLRGAVLNIERSEDGPEGAKRSKLNGH